MTFHYFLSIPLCLEKDDSVILRPIYLQTTQFFASYLLSGIQSPERISNKIAKTLDKTYTELESRGVQRKFATNKCPF